MPSSPIARFHKRSTLHKYMNTQVCKQCFKSRRCYRCENCSYCEKRKNNCKNSKGSLIPSWCSSAWFTLASPLISLLLFVVKSYCSVTFLSLIQGDVIFWAIKLSNIYWIYSYRHKIKPWFLGLPEPKGWPKELVFHYSIFIVFFSFCWWPQLCTVPHLELMPLLDQCFGMLCVLTAPDKLLILCCATRWHSTNSYRHTVCAVSAKAMKLCSVPVV